MFRCLPAALGAAFFMLVASLSSAVIAEQVGTWRPGDTGIIRVVCQDVAALEAVGEMAGTDGGRARTMHNAMKRSGACLVTPMPISITLQEHLGGPYTIADEPGRTMSLWAFTAGMGETRYYVLLYDDKGPHQTPQET